MRRTAGLIAISLGLSLSGSARAAPHKKASTPTPTAVPVASVTPTPSPTPQATPAPEASEEMPTINETEEEQWGQARGRGMIFGVRAGWHGYDPAGIGADGGPALGFSLVTPFKGPFFLGGSLAVHTGYTPAGGDNKKRYFDAEYAAVEGQYRRNAGRFNLYGAAGLGLVTANSSDVTGMAGTPNAGAPLSVTGYGAMAYLGGGAHLPVGGRMGLVGEVRYGIAPVSFAATNQVLLMGGLTASVGADFGF